MTRCLSAFGKHLFDYPLPMRSPSAFDLSGRFVISRAYAQPTSKSVWRGKMALRSFEWVSAWLSGIIPSGAPPPTPRRSPPRGSRERRALTPLLSPNHRLFALNHLVNLLSRHMLGLTACAIPRQLDDSIPRENCPHESAKGRKNFLRSPVRSLTSATAQIFH